MPVYMIMIMAVMAAFIGSNAFSFTAGSRLGAASTEGHWQRKLDAEKTAKQEAEKKLSDALSSANTNLRAVDQVAAQELQDKALRIHDLETDLKKSRERVPLSADCNKCTIDRRRLERVRDSIPADTNSGAASGLGRTSASGSPGSSAKDGMPAQGRSAADHSTGGKGL